MPRGGARVGAGRPRKNDQDHRLAGTRVHRGLSLVGVPAPLPPTSAPADASIEPPARLTPAARAYWDEWAPLAIARGTLIAETVPGFELLCTEAARRDNLTADIERQGLTFIKACADSAGDFELKTNPAEALRQKAVKQVENLMARYQLASMGKALARPKASQDDEREQLRAILGIK